MFTKGQIKRILDDAHNGHPHVIAQRINDGTDLQDKDVISLAYQLADAVLEDRV